MSFLAADITTKEAEVRFVAENTGFPQICLVSTNCFHCIYTQKSGAFIKISWYLSSLERWLERSNPAFPILEIDKKIQQVENVGFSCTESGMHMFSTKFGKHNIFKRLKASSVKKIFEFQFFTFDFGHIFDQLLIQNTEKIIDVYFCRKWTRRALKFEFTCKSLQKLPFINEVNWSENSAKKFKWSWWAINILWPFEGCMHASRSSLKDLKLIALGTSLNRIRFNEVTYSAPFLMGERNRAKLIVSGLHIAFLLIDSFSQESFYNSMTSTQQVSWRPGALYIVTSK